jgi:hypothetical protein
MDIATPPGERRRGRPPKEWNRERCLQLWAAGWSRRAIANELGVPVMRVQRCIHAERDRMPPLLREVEPLPWD